MYIGLHVITRYSCQMLIKLKFFSTDFQKYSNTKYLENPASGSRVFLCRQTDMNLMCVRASHTLTQSTRFTYSNSPGTHDSITPTKHRTHMTLLKTNFIFPSLQHYTPHVVTSSIVSSSWWWACKCPKHVEQITSSINDWVASI
jgi:hypothetical protein